MEKTRRASAYSLASGPGVLATVAPVDIARTLPRRVLRELGAPTRARLNAQFFPEGSWDLVAEPFGVHRYVREIFVDGVPVRESEQYQDMVARISDSRRKGSVWGCRTEADVDRYFERLLEMFDDMCEHGYRSHTEVGATRGDEVKVRVGRYGELVKGSGGNHRVSFAKLLQLTRIPVLVCGVHKSYLRNFAPGAAWEASILAEALDAAGLHVAHAPDVERVARRLKARALWHKAARRNLGVPVLASAHWGDATAIAYSGGSLLGT